MKISQRAMAVFVACLLAIPVQLISLRDLTETAYASSKAKIKILKARTLKAGFSTTIKVPRLKSNKIHWTSSNKKVATVSATGRVRAKKAGACVIKAKSGLRIYRCAITVKNGSSKNVSIGKGVLRDTAFALVSSAENSTTDYRSTYSYIEDIQDGRGYTCGIIGFTSATGDLLDVVETYVKLKPTKNGLKAYLPALRRAVGSDSHTGLGSSFVKAWKNACKSHEMIKAQDTVLKNQYLNPALQAAKKDGLSPLGQFVYYDALVMHGPGNDRTSFGGIRSAALKKAKTPKEGGSEAAYLKTFLKSREKIMLEEEAHSDLSRINAQRKFINTGNFSLKRPLKWTMYGDSFELK